MASLPTDHFIAQLALQIEADGHRAVGTAPVRPELFVPGTERVRTSLLATFVDVVAGHAPAGPIGPTVDLRLQMLGAPPRDGAIHLEATPLRVGRRLVVADTLLRAGPAGSVFARATTTFMNVVIPGDGIGADPPQLHPMAERSFDELLLPLTLIDAGIEGGVDGGVDERTVEVVPNPRLMIHEGTVVQGGAQALFAELAAEAVLGCGRPMTASDLDIRFLGRLRGGPLVAAVEPVPGPGGGQGARVVVTNRDRERDGVIAFVMMAMEPLG